MQLKSFDSFGFHKNILSKYQIYLIHNEVCWYFVDMHNFSMYVSFVSERNVGDVTKDAIVHEKNLILPWV